MNKPDSRVLAPIKSNISGGAPGLRYKIVQREDALGPTVEYEIDPNPVTLEDLEPTGESDQPGELDEAIAWLKETLRDGAMGAKDVLAMGKDSGISDRTLKRAKRNLGVRSQRGNMPSDPWSWVLPK